MRCETQKENKMISDDMRLVIARTIEESYIKDGYRANVWAKGGHVRVYVTRVLSGGRTRDIGYLAVNSDKLDNQLSCHAQHLEELALSVIFR
jgi:hypothetical protein